MSGSIEITPKPSGNSFRRNVVAVYTGQLYAALIAIVLVPIYVRYIGIEAYGLLGLFATLQAWFQLLDGGLTSTLTREAARRSSTRDDRFAIKKLLRALEVWFAGVALVGAALFTIGAGAVARLWLKVESLAADDVSKSIALMGIVIALRWMVALYKGALVGFEELIWVNGYTIVVATMRSALVIPILHWHSSTVVTFFSVQAVVGAIELLVIWRKTYQQLPGRMLAEERPTSALTWNGALRFSLSVAAVNVIWVGVVQSDKLLLSKLLPLGEYAQFTLMTVAAGGVLLCAAPAGSAILPRLSRLVGEGARAEFRRVYCASSEFVAVLVIPCALILAVWANEIVFVWTGDADIARLGAPVLARYSVANGLLAMSGLAYYFQFAKGDLRLHIIGTALFLTFLVPCLVIAVRTNGSVGAATAWCAVNAAYFLLWVARVHTHFEPSLHLRWLIGLTRPAVGSGIAIAITRTAVPELSPARLTAVGELACISGLVVAAAAGCSPECRRWVATLLRRRRPTSCNQ